jgi:hypothetical protein
MEALRSRPSWDLMAMVRLQVPKLGTRSFLLSSLPIPNNSSPGIMTILMVGNWLLVRECRLGISDTVTVLVVPILRRLLKNEDRILSHAWTDSRSLLLQLVRENHAHNSFPPGMLIG